MGEGVWSRATSGGEPADDGKRCVQPLNVAGLLLVEETESNSGEEGSGEGVTGSAGYSRWTLRVSFS